jgi:hypothetical protein
MVGRITNLFQSHFFSLIAIDKSCLPMIDYKNPKKNSCYHYRWPIIISIVLLIPAVIMTIVFVIQAKGNSQPSVIDASNKSSTNQKHNVNMFF